jgi:hypothetical protein
MARSVETTKAVRTLKMSAVVKLHSILALHPETALPDVLYGTLGYFHPYSLMLPNCGSTDAQNMEADGPGGAAILIRGVAVVSAGLRQARTGAVMSNPLLSRSSTP